MSPQYFIIIHNGAYNTSLKLIKIPSIFIKSPQNRPFSIIKIINLPPQGCILINWNSVVPLKKKDRSGLDYLDRAVSWCLFTSAVPLLPGTGPFVCCISALDRFEPHCATWARAASADTPMLMLNLVRVPAQHRNTNIQESRPQTLHQTSPWKQLQLQPRPVPAIALSAKLRF